MKNGIKSGIKYYVIWWVIVLALFNLVAFAIPVSVNENKFTQPFWIGYGFITAMFVVQLLFSILFYTKNSKDELFLSVVFLNIPVFRLGYIALFTSIIIGAIIMAVPQIPLWIDIIVLAVVVVFYAIAIITAKTAADAVYHIDKKIKEQTFFIKSLTVDADSLMTRAINDEMKAEAKRVYEAIRYSDPMSNNALAGIENQMQNEFNAFANAVQNDDIVLAKSSANELVILINDRNKKCKLLK